mmetsp:Transcript_26910/g.86509  ORF Transcript_26910/g.86509 Transcript_26910/m.86509 type:complete len:218 (+) Transcript_26910:1826-2479(+)
MHGSPAASAAATFLVLESKSDCVVSTNDVWFVTLLPTLPPRASTRRVSCVRDWDEWRPDRTTTKSRSGGGVRARFVSPPLPPSSLAFPSAPPPPAAGEAARRRGRFDARVWRRGGVSGSAAPPLPALPLLANSKRGSGSAGTAPFATASLTNASLTIGIPLSRAPASLAVCLAQSSSPHTSSVTVFVTRVTTRPPFDVMVSAIVFRGTLSVPVMQTT